MSTNDNSPCDRADLVRDYAFDELTAAERQSMERHFAQCPDCAVELDRWRLTTAALRVLPDVEIPRRIAFVSDKVFEPSWFGAFWNSAARLGFASACVLSAGLSFAAYHRGTEVRTVVQTTDVSGVSKAAIAEAVAKAVALAVDKAHADDVRITQAALDAVDRKYEKKQQNLMIAMQENLDQQKKRLNTYAILSSERMGAGE
jgi:anti-sigma factor RsiW